MNSKQTFSKRERISSQKEIDLLFSEGSSFIAYPLRIIYVERQALSEVSASVLVSVSKRRFKQAVKRNHLKRLIREAYRLNKDNFLQFLGNRGKNILVAFIFVGTEVCLYSDMESSMKKSLKILQDRLS